MSMKILKILLVVVFITSYGNFYNKVFAQSHENEISKAAQTSFLFPVGCSYGVDCWPVNYVDVDPAPDQVLDFKCNGKTEDAHKGSDFALGSIAQMREGVDVFAAAAGRVLRVRDGQSDSLKSAEDLAQLKVDKKECGNGVLVDHGNGLQTIYCHLRAGSVVVKPKQRVKPGQKIAQVGQSGLAEFPHLHFGVHWEGGVMDPYTGALSTAGCNQMKAPMWHMGLPMDYIPMAIFDGGFTSGSPDFTAIQKGSAPVSEISISSAAFVFWGGFYNLEEGDRVDLKIIDPKGNVFVQTQKIQDVRRARQYYFTGRKIGRTQLMAGEYKGITTVTRTQKDGETLTQTKEFLVTVR